MVKNIKLAELAKTIRSKNAGVDKLTFDIIFNKKEIYELVKKSKCITKKTISELYNIDANRICDFVEFDPANAIKFTIYRKQPSGSPGDGDIFGCQQYPPLLEIDIPIKN
jgi:hypothetical protein